MEIPITLIRCHSQDGQKNTSTRIEKSPKSTWFLRFYPKIFATTSSGLLVISGNSSIIVAGHVSVCIGHCWVKIPKLLRYTF